MTSPSHTRELIAAASTQHIATITLDAFVQDNGLDRVDFIKMEWGGANRRPC